MFGLVVMEVMTLSGHLSNINEMLFWPTFIRTPRLLETSEYFVAITYLTEMPIYGIYDERKCRLFHIKNWWFFLIFSGLAYLVLISGSLTLTRAKIDMAVPRKRGNAGAVTQHERALIRFFEAVLQAILRHVKFDVVKCVIIASPGFTKDQFFEFMINHANKIGAEGKVILDNKSRFIMVHASCGFKHVLKEVLQDPALQSKLADTKATEEVRSLEEFYKTLTNEPLKAFYGEKHVLRAAEAQAIEVLLISDKLFRAQDVVKRKKFVNLVDEVREYGGDVKIFSSMHVSGEQLEQLTGVCAILRFPMQELDDSDSEDE